MVVSCAMVLLGDYGSCDTYGIRDPEGKFIPKMTVDVGDKEILLKKINPEDKYRSIALKVNRRNKSLVRNVTVLKVVWIDPDNRAGKALLFSGPGYDPTQLTFRDSMTMPIALKILDPSFANLFVDKNFDDLFALVIDGRRALTSVSFSEKDKKERLGASLDTSIKVDKSSIAFNESNVKKGTFLNVDNRSQFNKTLGVTLPEKGLFLYQTIMRKPEQTRIPRHKWDRFSIEADSGIFIVLIPDNDPHQLAQLKGKEIQIRVFQGNQKSEEINIPIFVDLPRLDHDRTVGRGVGRDTSINVDKSSIAFNESNIKKGVFLNVDNRSGFNKTIGVKLPDESLFYYQKIIRKPELTKIPRNKWDRFSIEADSGIFIVLIPEDDPHQLAQLKGKEIQIRVFQGNQKFEETSIPIFVDFPRSP